MKVEITIIETRTVNIKYLILDAGVRYWEDAEVNGVDDKDGELIPFRVRDYWQPTIDIDSGTILAWPENTTAKIHYKVCDDGTYKVCDENRVVVASHDGYVPDALAPNGEGYGDYIILNVDETGKINNWNPELIRDLL